VPTCHVCDSPDSKLVLSREHDGLEVRRCASCGFAYLGSWSDSLGRAEELYDYYASLDAGASSLRHSSENRERQLELLERFSEITRGKRLLDVGCGDGQLLSTATEAGWVARGIDLSEAAISLCKARGLCASRTDFFSPELDDERFDVIVMSELIEHVPSPQRFFQRAERLLHEGGLLYLTTPNFGSLSRRALGAAWSVLHEEHIGYFERASLRKVATSSTSLRELRIDAFNITPSTFVALARGARGARREQAVQSHRQGRQGLDQELRRALRKSRVLSASKDLVNRGISRAGVGDTLVAWFQKPEGRSR